MDADGLVLTEEQRDRLRRFQDDGLVWLVNTAVLHPRGLALCVHLNQAGDPIGLSIRGDGDEPWVFGTEPEELGDVVDRYHAAERRREADWSPKLRG